MLSKELLNALQEFVDSHIDVFNSFVSESVILSESHPCEYMERNEMQNFVKVNKKPSFNEVLLNHIDHKCLIDSEVYKKAGIDRRHFSKIRSNPDYHPSKNTVIALALALELDYRRAIKLLGTAGYALSDSETFDLVITFCFEKKIYNIDDVNLALHYFSLRPLIRASE